MTKIDVESNPSSKSLKSSQIIRSMSKSMETNYPNSISENPARSPKFYHTKTLCQNAQNIWYLKSPKILKKP